MRIQETLFRAMALTLIPAGAAFAAGQEAPIGIAGGAAFFTSAQGYSLDGPPVGTGFRPHGHAIADFNADGHPDVVHAYQAGDFDFLSTPRFSIVFGNGDGTFADPVFYPTSGYTFAAVAADLDGDGDTDVALTQSLVASGNRVLVFRNAGDGTFGAQAAYFCGLTPEAIVSVDVDADGDLDLITANNFGSSLTVLRNDGNAGFNDRTDMPLASRPLYIDAADLNGDGAPELVVSFRTGTTVATLFNNDGGGAFAPSVSFGTRTYTNQLADIALGDVNGDGRADVVRTWGTSGFTPQRFTRYLNDGAGGFLPGTEFFSGVSLFSQTNRLRLIDMDADGALDIVGSGVNNVIDGWVFIPGLGNGAFGPGSFFATGYKPGGISGADADGDGRVDVLITNELSKTLKVQLQQEAGFGLPPSVPVEWDTRRLAVADIDLDGDPDVVTAYSTSVRSLLNNGDGTFAAHSESFPLGCMEAIRLADLNGDGYPDLVLTRNRNCPPYNLHTLINDGDGTFGQYTVWPLGSAGDNELVTLDWDNDGDTDIGVSESLSCPSCGNVLLYLVENLGNAVFAPPVILSDPQGRSIRRIEAADMNGDGNMDVIGSAAGEGVGVLLGNGDGTFQLMQNFPVVADTPINAASWIAIDDFDFDGTPDVAFAGTRYDDASIGSVDIAGVLLNDGQGALTPASWRYAAHQIDLLVQYGIDTIDANDDGYRDIVVGTLSEDNVLLYLGGADAAIQPAQRYGVDGNVHLLRAADFDLDGLEDVAVIVQNNGAGVTVLDAMATPAPVPGDLDGDGDVDSTDLNILLSDFGCTGGGCPGDADGDGDTDTTDLNIVLSSFGQSG